MKYLLKTRIIDQFIHDPGIRSSDAHANESINRSVTPPRPRGARLNKILVKLSQNELKQMESQLGEEIVRVLNEKRVFFWDPNKFKA